MPFGLLPQPAHAPHCRSTCRCSLALSPGVQLSRIHNDDYDDDNEAHDNADDDYIVNDDNYFARDCGLIWQCRCRTFQPRDHAQ